MGEEVQRLTRPFHAAILPHLRRQMPYRIVHYSVFALRAKPRQERNSIFLQGITVQMYQFTAYKEKRATMKSKDLVMA
jgi:hypothetical protein